MRTSTSVGLMTGRGTSRTSTGPPLTGCTTCFMMSLRAVLPIGPPAARLQVVVIRTGSGASARQVSTGASALLPNPAATGRDAAVSRTGTVAVTVSGEGAGRTVEQGRVPRDPHGPARREVPADGDLVPAAPGDRVLDEQAADGQRPPAAVPRAAGQVPEPVVDRLAADPDPAGLGGEPADPGPPPGPERAPHLGRVRPVQLARCCARRWTARSRAPARARRWTCRCRPAAATPSTCSRQPNVSACAWAGSDGGHGGPTSASRCQPPAAARTSPVSGSTSSGSSGLPAPGPQRGEQVAVDRVAVVEQRDLAVRE